MQYPKHWRMAFLMAFFIHLIAWLAGSFILNGLHAQTVVPLGEQNVMEWTDVPEEDLLVDQSPPIVEPPAEAVVADPSSEVKEQEEESPVVTENDVTIAKEMENQNSASNMQKEKAVISKSSGNHQMGTPPSILQYYYPPITSQVGYTGTITVKGRVQRDGSVGKVVVVVGSGKPNIDKVAIEAVKKWKFKPGLDLEKEPIATDAMIVISFNKKQQDNGEQKSHAIRIHE
ncbi:MAG: sodium pump decarboxylase [Firmicutes bacterium]|nr:sodium pump decarboxylase [Bacillota bacterium]